MPSPALRVVLVRPRDPNNIGACARAMANFGLDDLRVVDPYPPVWREAKSAVGASELLRRAVCVDTVVGALEGCRRVLGTSSLQRRRPGLPVLGLPAWRPEDGRTAVLFGPEKTGLTAEHLSHCSAILHIPTAAGCPSMNLAAAVAVTCYEWVRRKGGGVLAPAGAPLEESVRARLLDLLADAARRAGYGRTWPARTLERRLRQAVSRWGLTGADAGMLLAVFRSSRSSS